MSFRVPSRDGGVLQRGVAPVSLSSDTGTSMPLSPDLGLVDSLPDSLFFEQLDREAALLGAADDPLDPTADFAVTESDLVLAEALSHQKDPFTFAEPPVFGLDERVVSTLALRNAAQVIATAHSPIATPTPPSLQVPEEQHLLPASSLPFYLAPPSSPAPPQDVYPPLPTEESIEEIVEQALRDVSSGGFVQTQRLVPDLSFPPISPVPLVSPYYRSPFITERQPPLTRDQQQTPLPPIYRSPLPHVQNAPGTNPLPPPSNRPVRSPAVSLSPSTAANPSPVIRGRFLRASKSFSHYIPNMVRSPVPTRRKKTTTTTTTTATAATATATATSTATITKTTTTTTTTVTSTNSVANRRARAIARAAQAMVAYATTKGGVLFPWSPVPPNAVQCAIDYGSTPPSGLMPRSLPYTTDPLGRAGGLGVVWNPSLGEYTVVQRGSPMWRAFVTYFESPADATPEEIVTSIRAILATPADAASRYRWWLLYYNAAECSPDLYGTPDDADVSTLRGILREALDASSLGAGGFLGSVVHGGTLGSGIRVDESFQMSIWALSSVLGETNKLYPERTRVSEWVAPYARTSTVDILRALATFRGEQSDPTVGAVAGALAHFQWTTIGLVPPLESKTGTKVAYIFDGSDPVSFFLNVLKSAFRASASRTATGGIRKPNVLPGDMEAFLSLMAETKEPVVYQNMFTNAAHKVNRLDASVSHVVGIIARLLVKRTPPGPVSTTADFALSFARALLETANVEVVDDPTGGDLAVRQYQVYVVLRVFLSPRIIDGVSSLARRWPDAFPGSSTVGIPLSPAGVVVPSPSKRLRT